MKTRSLRLMWLVSAVCLLSECKQTPDKAVAQIPKWVSQTHFAPHETRRVFEDNVELSVSVANTSSSPVIVEHMNRDKRVVLKAADGTESPLHPFSVGVAKPILLHPGEKTQTSLLFKPLKGEAQSLEIYDESSALTHTTKSFNQGAAK